MWCFLSELRGVELQVLVYGFSYKSMSVSLCRCVCPVCIMCQFSMLHSA